MSQVISFGTDGWRDTLDRFTSPRVKQVGQAVASYLREEGHAGETVAIGYDARESSPGFAEDLAAVLTANGFDVVMPTRDRPTPLTAYAIVDRDLAGALMLTASHNPPEYNGVKFIPESGAPALPAVTDAIESHLAEPDPLAPAERGEIEEVDFLEPHFEHAMDLLDPDVGELTVLYDAIHGSGRGTTDELLERAGVTVDRLRCDRDPTFGGGSPEPAPEMLGELMDRVTDGEADLGIANDGDADRLAVVTPERGYLDENLFYAAIYDYLLEDDAGPAVRTVSTSFLIDRIAEAHGQTVAETAVGFKWVAEEMRATDALMGGEESGGFSLRGHIREKDGVLVALLAAIAESEEPLDSRVDRLLDTHGEIHQDKSSVDCPDEEKARVIDGLDGIIPDTVAGEPVGSVVTIDGFKLLLEDGSWLLVRPSGTEPKMRVYAEAGSPERVEALLEDGRHLVEQVR
jgi:phosphomannomutase